ncbi:hypothetical protein GCM10009678_16280 [Actinomadura kijaniata]|uniref:Lysophospholipase L1-like esterase n=1 Tax=Actinomadura namibiensis TaxID=182080 RepID=A0A7W3LIX4_ACTNM|nr:GDSL-type esterase/lipase family protein [Actinomadura namibiensis]MBA8948893.1 lysophospholipase L1-like esterase [Actinomadura namibiensis]
MTTWTAAYRSAMVSPFESMTLVHGPRGFADQTVRQVVRVRGEGERLRVRFSNLYGARPLVVGRVVAGGAAVTFGGGARVTVGVGEEAVSDPFAFPLKGEADLTVSAYLPEETGPATYHPFALRTTWIAPGDGDAPGGEESESGFFLSGVDVAAEAGRPVVAAFGDSLTDGVGTTPGADRRYPDVLARLVPAASVVNLGIAGNRLVSDEFGERGVARFAREVPAVPGVTHAVVQVGLNDIGMPVVFDVPPVTFDELTAGYRAIAGTAARHGITAVVATVTPFGGAQPPGVDLAAEEALRRRLNAWLRANEAGFAAVADLDAALRDPADPSALRPDHDSGDHLHPDDAGAEAMAETVARALGI